MDAVLYREPVELNENRDDMFRRLSAGDDPDVRVLKNVQSVDVFGRESGKDCGSRCGK